MTVSRNSRRWIASTGLALAASSASCAVQATDDPTSDGADSAAEAARHAHPGTRTPIQHVIIVVGENHSFDNLFGTYQPRHGQHIDNLVSKGIVNADGSPGPHFARAQQRIGSDTDRYHTETASTGAF